MSTVKTLVPELPQVTTPALPEGTYQETDEWMQTPDAFRAWLESMSPDAVVGITNVSWDCAIARFLRERTGAEKASAWERGYRIDGVWGDHKAADWQRNFVRTFDTWGIMASIGDEDPDDLDALLLRCVPVTAHMALAILNLC